MITRSRHASDHLNSHSPTASTLGPRSPSPQRSWPGAISEVPTSFCSTGIDVARFRGAPPADADAPTILFLGRHEPRKGLAVLLDALSSLPPDVTVRVAGDGPTTARLRERHRGAPRISWLGRLTEADKIRHLRAASVLCAPSRHGESFGMVLLEAMAAGTPAVASDAPGYRSLSDQGSAVFLVPPDDIPTRSPPGYCACCRTIGSPQTSVAGETTTFVASR